AATRSASAREARSVAPVTMIGRASRTPSRAASSRSASIPRSSTSTSPAISNRSDALASASNPRLRNPRTVISARRSSSSTTSTRIDASTAASAAATNPSASSTSDTNRSTGGGEPSSSASSSSAFIRASVDRSRCSAAARSALRDELVSDATYRLDPGRLAERAPHLVHCLLHAVLKPRVGRAPHPLEQLRPRDHLARALREKVQRGKRPALEPHLAPRERDLHPRRIDTQPPVHHHPVRARSAVAQRSAHARQQHLAVRPLRDVIGRSTLDAQDLV